MNGREGVMRPLAKRVVTPHPWVPMYVHDPEEGTCGGCGLDRSSMVHQGIEAAVSVMRKV